MKCNVLLVLLGGMEAWTLKKIDTKRIGALEMWMYRRILNTENIVNRETNERRGFAKNAEGKRVITIKRRKLQYLGHVMRGIPIIATYYPRKNSLKYLWIKYS